MAPRSNIPAAGDTAGRDDGTCLGGHSNRNQSITGSQLRTIVRRDLDGRVLGFLVENADGFAIAAKSRRGSAGKAMWDALAGAVAMLGGVAL